MLRKNMASHTNSPIFSPVWGVLNPGYQAQAFCRDPTRTISCKPRWLWTPSAREPRLQIKHTLRLGAPSSWLSDLTESRHEGHRAR